MTLPHDTRHKSIPYDPGREDGFWMNRDEMQRIREACGTKFHNAYLCFVQLSWIASEERSAKFTCPLARIAEFGNRNQAVKGLRDLQDCNAIRYSLNEDDTVTVTILSEVRL